MAESKKPGSPKGTPGKATLRGRAQKSNKLTDAQKKSIRKMVEKGSKFNFDNPKPRKESTAKDNKFLGEEGDITSIRQGMAKRKKYSQERARAADKKATPKKNAGVRSRGPKAGSSTISKVVGRAKTTAREARDVYTAVGSAAQALRKSPQEGIPVKKTIKNIGTQIKETARAAATGKKGTTAYKVKPDPYSKAARKAAGGKGFVFYDVTKPKKR